MLDEKQIFLDVKAETKNDILSFISHQAYELGITDDEQALCHDFKEREKEFSTGLQDGFAIPHARSENVKKVAIMYLRNEKDIDWESLDDEPVRYIFALLVPIHYEGNVHLKMISKLATCLLEDDFKNKVKSSDNKTELKKYIQRKMEEGD